MDTQNSINSAPELATALHNALRFPTIASAQATFAAMTNFELFDVVSALLAAHHSFNQQGGLYSALNDSWTRMQSWADQKCDLLQDELRLACDEYLSRDLTHPDDIENRNLALASAYRVAAGSARPFSVAIVVTQETVGA